MSSSSTKIRLFHHQKSICTLESQGEDLLLLHDENSVPSSLATSSTPVTNYSLPTPYIPTTYSPTTTHDTMGEQAFLEAKFATLENPPSISSLFRTFFSSDSETLTTVGVLGTSYRTIGILSWFLGGITTKPPADQAITLFQGHIMGNVENRKIQLVVGSPHEKTHCCDKMLTDWYNSVDIFILIIDEHDYNPVLLSSLLTMTERTAGAKQMFTVFGRGLDLVHLRNILLDLSEKRNTFYFTSNQFWEGRPTRKLFVSLLNNGNLDTIKGLGRISEKSIIAFDSKGEKKTMSLRADRAKSVGTDDKHRERARALLGDITKMVDSNEDPDELEKTIFEMVHGELHEYVSMFSHQKIRLQRVAEEQKGTSIIGKRKRTIDDFLGSQLEPIAKAWKGSASDEVHVPGASTLMVQWFYMRLPTEFICMFENQSIHPLQKVAVGEELNSQLENHFLGDLRAEPLDVYFPDLGNISLYLLTNEVYFKSHNVTKKLLARAVYYENIQVDLPPYWKMFRQDKPFVSLTLDPEEPIHRALVGQMQESLRLFCAEEEEIVISFIQQIQHCKYRQEFCLERDNISIANKTETSETPLFFGSCRISPNFILASDSGIPFVSDPNPNSNFGKGIHLSSEPWYADERAYTYLKGDVIHKQIFMVQAALGISNHAPAFDVNMKRPPKRVEENNMPIFYNSVVGSYVRGGHSTNVHVVFVSNQVYPTFLLDYFIKKKEPAQ